jgi:hypothetical protein
MKPGSLAQLPTTGPSKRLRIRVRLCVRFHAGFACKPDKGAILHLTCITMVCLHISAKQIKNQLAGQLWQQIVHPMVCRFVRVDTPTTLIIHYFFSPERSAQHLPSPVDLFRRQLLQGLLNLGRLAG